MSWNLKQPAHCLAPSPSPLCLSPLLTNDIFFRSSTLSFHELPFFPAKTPLYALIHLDCMAILPFHLPHAEKIFPFSFFLFPIKIEAIKTLLTFSISLLEEPDHLLSALPMCRSHEHWLHGESSSQAWMFAGTTNDLAI